MHSRHSFDPNRSACYSGLSDEAFKQFDSLCSWFEQELRAGRSPRIEDLLVGVASAHRPTYLRDLVEIEIDPEVNPRWTPEQVPDEEEYKRRFPDDSDAISRAFRELHAPPADAQVDRSSDQSSQQSGSAASYSDALLLPVHLVIQRKLGSGGFGTVYVAYHKNLCINVAVKVLKSDRLHDPVVRDMFVREARTVARLKHPNLAAIHDLLELEDRRLAIVMEYVEGGTLHDLRKSWPNKSANIDELVVVMEQVAQAVHFIHTAGDGTLVHRDLKPENIILDEFKRPYVVDFGLAALTSIPTEGQGEGGGTPQYMSPEQVRRNQRQPSAIDSRSDIWSLGVILYKMLTGKFPFDGSQDEIMDAIEDDTWDCSGPKKLNPDIDSQLDEIVRRCLTKSPRRRFQSAEDLAAALHDYRKARTSAARSICKRYEYEMEEEIPLNRVVSERIEAGQYELAAALIHELHLTGEFPPEDLMHRMIGAHRYKESAQWIQTFHLTDSSLPEDAISRLTQAGRYKTAARWIKKFERANKFPPGDLVRRMIEVGQYGDAAEVVWMFSLANEFPPKDLIRKMIDASQYRDAAEAVERFNLTEEISIEDRVLLIQGMVQVGQHHDAYRHSRSFGVIGKFPPGSFQKRKI